jgi:hypothetical protein
VFHHAVLLHCSVASKSRHVMMRGEWSVIHLHSLLTKPPEFAARTVVPIRVLDARGFRYDMKNGAFSCRVIDLNVTPRKPWPRAALVNNCFHGVTFRSCCPPWRAPFLYYSIGITWVMADAWTSLCESTGVSIAG